MRPTALPGWPRPTRPATARRCARAHTGAVTVVEVEQGEVLEHPRQRGHPPSKQVEAAAQRSFLPTGRVEKLGRRRRSLTRWGLWWLAGSCVGVGRERKLRRKCTRRKRRQGGCSGLRSPWRGSRRWRRPGNGGGTLGQRHNTRTVTWSASDMGDGAVGTGGREARRGEGDVGSAAAASDTGRSERLLTRTHTSGHRRPRQPTRVRRRATLPLTTGPTRQCFFVLKITPGRK
jgi:hypothetical protein